MSYSSRAVRPYPSQRPNVVILPYDVTWCSLAQTWLTSSIGQTGTWTTANTAVGFWITAPYNCTVYRLGWCNGSAAGGDTDVAIYDSDGTTRLVSTGATAGSGNSQWQFVDTTDQALTAGKDYFVALNHSATTANQLHITPYSNSVGYMNLCSIKVQAVGATALPDPFVPADPTATANIPNIGLMLTSLGTS